jgi:integrase
VNLFLSFFRRRIPSSAEILGQMITELENLRRSERHVYALRNDLLPFVRWFPRIEKVTADDVSFYLREIPGTIGPRRRDNILLSIQQLSRFARSRGYLDEERKSAAEKVRRINAPRRDVVIWSPGEAKLLIDGFQQISPHWVPLVSLSLFAGLRTSELLRLNFEAVKFDQRAIVIGRLITKTRSSRVVPMSENLLTWLEPYRNRVGAIRGPHCEKTSENLLSIALALVRHETGLERRDNAARHSYGTYRVALTKDYAAVSFELGNSVRMVRECYYNPQPESAGRAYFEIAA